MKKNKRTTKDGIIDLFELDFKHWKISFILFFMAIFYSLFKAIALSDMDKFREAISLMMQNDIYLGLTFLTFWSILVVLIFFGAAFKKQINYMFGIFILLSVIFNFKYPIFLYAAIGSVLVGLIILAFKKPKGGKK